MRRWTRYFHIIYICIWCLQSSALLSIGTQFQLIIFIFWHCANGLFTPTCTYMYIYIAAIVFLHSRLFHELRCSFSYNVFKFIIIWRGVKWRAHSKNILIQIPPTFNQRNLRFTLQFKRMFTVRSTELVFLAILHIM